jgi:hypothetical protein
VTVAVLTKTPPHWWLDVDDDLLATYLEVYTEIYTPQNGG